VYSGQQGNLTERVTASVVSLLMMFAVFIGVLYLLLWQTYVLWLEAVLIFVEMAFLAFEIVFAVVTIVTFARYTVLHLYYYHANGSYGGRSFMFVCVYFFAGYLKN